MCHIFGHKCRCRAPLTLKQNLHSSRKGSSAEQNVHEMYLPKMRCSYHMYHIKLRIIWCFDNASIYMIVLDYLQCSRRSFFWGARSDHYLLSQNWARSYHYLFASKMSQIRSWSRSDHSRSFLKLRFTTSHHYFSTKLTLPTLFITFLCINFLQRLKNWKNFLKELWKKFSYKKILV